MPPLGGGLWVVFFIQFYCGGGTGVCLLSIWFTPSEGPKDFTICIFQNMTMKKGHLNMGQLCGPWCKHPLSSCKTITIKRNTTLHVKLSANTTPTLPLQLTKKILYIGRWVVTSYEFGDALKWGWRHSNPRPCTRQIITFFGPLNLADLILNLELAFFIIHNC